MKKIILFLAVFSATLVTAQNVPSYVPTNGLVGWWPFNGNANDESGNGNNGTISGSSLTWDRDSIANSAYYFDGNDYISVNRDTMGTFSVSVWFRTSQNTMYTPLLDAYSSTWEIYLNYLTPIFTRWVSLPANYQQYSSLTSCTANEWNNLIYSVEPGVLRIFLNGSVLYNDSTLGTIYNTSGTLYFGASISGSAQYFTGELDDIALWNRTLSANEAQSIYLGCIDNIQAQPKSATFQTVPGTAHFTAVHSDTNATYQWQQNNGTGWSNLSDFGIYSGTTTDSLVLTGITTSLNSYGYRCIIDACTMDTTEVAYLTVVDNVGIEESAKGLTVSPNPTSGFVSVNLNSAAEYNVYNMTGQKVAEGKTEGKIDLTNFPSGTYQLILNTEEGISTHTIQKL